MSQVVARRERLSRFVDLARMYRGWSRQQMAESLGRDISKIVPDSGNPKLDLVVALAEALDWQVGDVARCVWEEPTETSAEGDDFAVLDARAIEAHRAGDWRALLAGGRRLLAAARTPADRARALNRLSGANDGLGRHARSLECLQEALALAPLPANLELMRRVNRAGSHNALWNRAEARAVAGDIVARFEPLPPEGRLERVAQAFALMHRGQCARRAIAQCPETADRNAEDAHADLSRAAVLFQALAREFGDDSYGGVANTCRGALLEVGCELGTVAPKDAIATITQAIGAVEDPERSPPGDWLESYGWWCIYGCNVAMRHLKDPEFHRAMAILTNKAIEVAERLGNWSLRERAFSLELVRRERLERTTGFDADWVLDEDDVRTIAGTMGRFPSFRETGWQILSQARIVEGA
jgi:tetratricopeptide (TPR) repeat protein